MKIPLFPLNTVLFPGMLFPLYIFEERYKTMVNQCLHDNTVFGVVLAKTKQAVVPNVANIFSDDLYTIGTTARITAVEKLTDGRMKLITVGHERFVIKNIWPSDQDFLMGEVNPFPMQDSYRRAEITTRRLRPLMEQYIYYLTTASGEDLSGASLPDDPAALAYLAGNAVQGSPVDKQRLLAASTLRELMDRTANVLDRENKILAYMIKAHQAHQQIKRLPFVDYSLN